MWIHVAFSNRGIIETVRTIMKGSMTLGGVVLTMVILSPGEAFSLFGFSEDETKPKESSPAIPPKYQGKQMPNGWRTDPQVLVKGKAIYEGKTNPKVNCALCHGVDGKPTRIGMGAPDLSNPAKAQGPDALWFWRISEGKRRTTMQGHAKRLTEEQRWQVIAYIRTFAQQ